MTRPSEPTKSSSRVPEGVDDARMPTDLLTMLVHNLKAPLTGVLAPLELLRDGDLGPVTDAQRLVLDEMAARGDELVELIDGLLQLRSLESGSLPLVLEVVTPGSVLEEAREEWAFRMRQADVTFDVSVEPGAGPVLADRTVLRRVIGNLLDNALACGGPGTHVALTAGSDDAGVTINVRDNGPGIRPEYHEAIFRAFERAHAGDTTGRHGWGLGLAFCRAAVEAHGGRIQVESEVGRGSVFHVFLPAAPADAASGGRAP